MRKNLRLLLLQEQQRFDDDGVVVAVVFLLVEVEVEMEWLYFINRKIEGREKKVDKYSEK